MKTRYKAHLLRESVEAYSKIVELRVQANKLKKGRKGLKVGCQATILDASNILSKCWNELEPATIIGCWIHSKCLPHTPQEIGEQNREYRSQHHAVKEICQLFSSIDVNEESSANHTLMELKEIAIVLNRDGHEKGSKILR